MPTTKTTTAIWNSVTLTAGAGDTTSSAVDLADGYGASLFLKITNGATGPTVAAQIQVQLSPDNSEWYDFGGAMVGNTSNSGEVELAAMDIPIGAKYLRVVGGSNTGQDVTVEADVTEVTRV
jgi:hypothetical protein